jgi:hypothetical protein
MNKEKFRLRDLSVGEFFKLSLGKILVDFLISLLIVIVFLSVIPNLSSIFMQLPLFQAIIDIIINTLLFMILLYPYACIIRYLTWRKR